MSTITRYLLDDPDIFRMFTDDVKKKISIAATNTVNIEAALARKNLAARVKNEFTLRNTFTVRQLQYTQMPKKTVSSLKEIKATVGFTPKADYMARQDTGGDRSPKSGPHLAIPTDRSRVGKDKNRGVAQHFRLGNLGSMTLRGDYSRNFRSKKARGVARAYIAAKYGLLVHYGKDIFQVRNFRKRGNKIKFKIEEIYEMSYAKTYTPARNYFLEECVKAVTDNQNIFNNEMKKAGV